MPFWIKPSREVWISSTLQKFIPCHHSRITQEILYPMG